MCGLPDRCSASAEQPLRAFWRRSAPCLTTVELLIRRSRLSGEPFDRATGLDWEMQSVNGPAASRNVWRKVRGFIVSAPEMRAGSACLRP